MANYATLISAIQSVITANGNNEITGPILQQTLISVVNSLGSGYQYIGIATPETIPGTPDQRVFYLAGPGVYPNFGPATISGNQIGIFKYSSDWVVELLQFPIADGSVTTQKLADESVTIDKLAQSVVNLINAILVENTSPDLEIADNLGNVLVRFENGGIKTKNFDSSIPRPTIEDGGDDLEIADGDGNILVRFSGGNIKTKNFDSSTIDSMAFATKFNVEEQAVYDKVVDNIDDKTVVLVLTTDAHITTEEQNTLVYAKVFRKMAENIGADALVSLGDIINEKSGNSWNINNNKNRIELYMKETRVSCIPFLYALAHHEMYSSGYPTFLYGYPATKVLGKTNKYQRHLIPVFDPNNYANYYVDVNPLNFRMIFLDSTNVAGHPVGYTTATINWLSSVLSVTDKKVALFTHAPSKNGYTYNPNNQISKVVNDTEIRTALNNFVTNGGVILGHFCGHAHCDNLGKDSDMNYYIIQTACSVPRVDGGVPTNERPTAGNPIYYSNRAIGTINEYCIDFVCIHTDTNVVNMFRFGVGNDRTINN